MVGSVTGSPLVDDTDILEGTGIDNAADLAHEIFISQALMLQAIDGMGRKTEELANKLADHSLDKSVLPLYIPSAIHLLKEIVLNRILQRLNAIDAHIAGISAVNGIFPPPNSYPPTPGANGVAAPASKSYEHIVQLQERLLAELAGFGRKLEVSNVSRYYLSNVFWVILMLHLRYGAESFSVNSVHTRIKSCRKFSFAKSSDKHLRRPPTRQIPLDLDVIDITLDGLLRNLHERDGIR